jgi:hypothetical protein
MNPPQSHSRTPVAKKAGQWLVILACSIVVLITALRFEWRDQSPATPGYMPGWDEARQALQSALSAWRDAPRSAPLPPTFAIPSVQFIDKRRRSDQRLLSFEILSQTDIENARQFTVRLTVEGEERPQLVKYNIVGRQPVWVFRLEDYEMFSHWEHDMDEPAAGTAKKAN